MSLKAFHIFFILCSIALVLGFGVWLYNQSLHVYAGLAFVGVLGIAAYLIWFLKKSRPGSK